MPTDVGVLLPVRLETRFRDGDLWLRVVPDEPWFVRDDPRISAGELDVLTRYAADLDLSPSAQKGVPPPWRELVAQVGAGRAAYLHRRFVTIGPNGRARVRALAASEQRDEPAPPRIVGFPPRLVVAAAGRDGQPEPVLTLVVNRERLLADFADPDIPGDRRWWEDWDEAVAVGVAGVVPAEDLPRPLTALYVVGLGDSDPVDLFGSLAAEGRVGLVAPGTATNTVDGAPAAPLAADADTWWQLVRTTASASDRDVSAALTGDRDSLGNLPGGDHPHRVQGSALVRALWPALWGFAAGQVWDVSRDGSAAEWAGRALYPEGAYPAVRVGPQPYGLLPTTAWESWQAHDDDPALEARFLPALVRLRAGHAAAARRRGTAPGTDVEALLDLIGDTPTSSRFRYRLAWPLELWWLGVVGSGLPQRWRDFSKAWSAKYRLADDLGLASLRRYGARGESRLVRTPLVVPSGRDPAVLPDLLALLADTALTSPSSFADTARLEAQVLRGGDSLLLRLAVRSLQLAIGDIARERDRVVRFDPEPFSRRLTQRGRLEQLVASVSSIDTTQPSAAVSRLLAITDALRALRHVPVADLERRLQATIDCSSHRIDPWLVGVAQRRLDDLTRQRAPRRLGAYGWVDDLAPGSPGPTAAGLLPAPSPGQALAAAVLRDRAVSEPGARWDLDLTSRRARTAQRIAEHVRVGAHLSEALGREIERIVGAGVAVERLRRDFPVRAEHAGRRVCDGLRLIRRDPFPVTLNAGQRAALADLREGLDGYADLLVAEAVYHLVEGRADVAGAVMQAAAGLSRPPDLALLRTPREGRAVGSSVVIALPHVPDQPLPLSPADRAVRAPAPLADPSTARFDRDTVGRADTWTFHVSTMSDAGLPTAGSATLSLADLGLDAVDALTLTRTDLELLARERAADLLDLDHHDLAVTGGDAGEKYEEAARLVGLIGRSPADARSLSEDQAADDPAAGGDAETAERLVAVRSVAVALADGLLEQLARLDDGDMRTADATMLRRLVLACTRWGIAPDPPPRARPEGSPALDTARRRLERLIDKAVRAAPQLEERLRLVPAEPEAISAMPRREAMEALGRLVCATGQLAVTASADRGTMPDFRAAGGPTGLDATWLTVVAAVRPALAPLEVHQLAARSPLVGWTNRRADPWQTDAADGRRLVVVYAPAGLNLREAPMDRRLSLAAVDRFSEVVPSGQQLVGAAFGFDAPAARAQQAILLAVPPSTTVPLDDDTLLQVLRETRELAHARMARPVDLDEQFWGLAPTALFPATGRTATFLEGRR
jgi:hypothetical protein